MARRIADTTVKKARKEIDQLLKQLDAGTITRRKLEAGLEASKKHWERISIMDWSPQKKR